MQAQAQSRTQIHFATLLALTLPLIAGCRCQPATPKIEHILDAATIAQLEAPVVSIPVFNAIDESTSSWKNGLDLAWNEMKDQTGVGANALALVHDDTPLALLTPQTIVARLSDYASFAVPAVIVATRDASLANLVASEARRLELPIIIVSTIDLGSACRGNIWALCLVPSDTMLGRALALHARDVFKIKRPAILQNTTVTSLRPLTEAFVIEVKSAGMAPAPDLAIASGQQDFSPQLAMIRAANADSIAVFAPSTDVQAFIEQTRLQKISLPIFTAAELDVAASARNANDAAVICPSAKSLDDSAFATSYQSRFATLPDRWSVRGDQVLRLLALSWSELPPQLEKSAHRAALRDALSRDRKISGPTGTVGFNGQGLWVEAATVSKL